MANLSIQRVLALPQTYAASTMYIVRAADAETAELYFSSQDGSSVRRLPTKTDIETMLAAQKAAGVDKLTNARTIAVTGDATWQVSFDGSQNVDGALTLAATGVAAGEYPVVTVDAKGRVTAARALQQSDIPSLDGTKIISDISVNTSGNAATADEADKLSTARKINGVDFNGTADITINAVDSTPRIAVSEKGVANGVATLDGNGLVPASQLPSYVDDVLEFADAATFPAQGETSKIYVALDTNLVYRWSGSLYILIPSGVGLADAALKLNTARTFDITGDATWQVTFDGTQNVTGALTLANTGIAAGEYTVLTVDAKGRATGGRALVEADIPTLTSAVVASAASVTLAGSEW